MQPSRNELNGGRETTFATDVADGVASEAAPDIREFLLPGTGLSALLIHGLTGTPYEMRYLGERLTAAGIRSHGVRLAGHCGKPEDLGATDYSAWYRSAVDGFERLRDYGDPIVVVGLSMGALLAARLALDQPEAVLAVAMLAPAFVLPRNIELTIRLLKPFARYAERLYLHKDGPSDVYDAGARRVHPGLRLIPVKAVLSLNELSASLRPRLGQLKQPTLVIHSRRDHTCPYNQNVNLLMKRLGSTNKRLVALQESFHVISVDNEKDRVADEVVDFVSGFRVASQSRAV